MSGEGGVGDSESDSGGPCSQPGDQKEGLTVLQYRKAVEMMTECDRICNAPEKSQQQAMTECVEVVRGNGASDTVSRGIIRNMTAGTLFFETGRDSRNSRAGKPLPLDPAVQTFMKELVVKHKANKKGALRTDKEVQLLSTQELLDHQGSVPLSGSLLLALAWAPWVPP